MSRKPWTFITNHAAVLLLIHKFHQITAREIAGRLEITERSVQRIIRDLEDAGYVTRKKVGRVNHYRVDPKRPLRRSDQLSVQILDLLDILEPGQEPLK